jgi:hypothetical protein
LATFGETGWCGGLAPFSGPKEGRKNRVIPEGKFLYFPHWVSCNKGTFVATYPRFISELEAELIKRREEKRQALKERIEGMVKEHGISLAELFPQAGKIESQAKTKRKGAESEV